MSNSNNFLKYGDCILLATKDGYLQSQGFTKPSVHIQVALRENMTFQRNIRDYVFQVAPRMMYDAFKEYMTFKKFYERGHQAHETSKQSKKDVSLNLDTLKLQQLQKKLIEEIEQNKKIFERRAGEFVQYGNEMQLVHYDSKGFLEGSKTCADIDKSCNLLSLVSQGSKAVCFVIEPRYKYRMEGQKVTYGDVVTFRNIKLNMFIHISDGEIIKPSPHQAELTHNEGGKGQTPIIIDEAIDERAPPNRYAPLYEVNMSQSRSKFTVMPYRFFDQDIPGIIKGGQVVRFQHSESSGFVCSDDTDFTADGLAEVFLWNFKGKATDIESVTTQSLFELEIVNDDDQMLGQTAMYSGNISNNQTALKGGMLFRLRHFNTGRLVVVQDIEVNGSLLKTLGLSEHIDVEISYSVTGSKEVSRMKILNPETENFRNDNSIFRLVSTGVDIDNRIRSYTSVQIQHVLTNTFIGQEHVKKFQIESGSSKQVGKVASSQYILHVDSDDDVEVDKIVQKQTQKIVDDKLHPTFFKKMADSDLNQGSREFLTTIKNPSFENAFFIIPENNEYLQNLLYVHASVNLIKSFIPEIASPVLGASKDRQKKILNVLQEMFNFLNFEDSLMINNQDMDIAKPFSLLENQSWAHKDRKLKHKQKIFREMRVIENCCQILYLPFAKKAFDLAMIQQEMAITQVCKLTYQLLSRIVSEYTLNELYASQWIALLLHHILTVNPSINVGVDSFLTQLVDQNQQILETQITPDLIKMFVMRCNKGPETPRLLKLLRSLCSVKLEPIRSNQNDIVSIIFNRTEDISPKGSGSERFSAFEKAMMPLRRLNRKSEIELCTDVASNQWIKLSSLNNAIVQLRGKPENYKMSEQEKKYQNLFETFKELLDLLSECCLGRNQACQAAIMNHFDYKLLLNIVESPAFLPELKSRCLKLMISLYLDHEPFQQLIVPSETIVWKDLPKLSTTPTAFKQSIADGSYNFPIMGPAHRIPRRFLTLKAFAKKYLKNTKGVMRIKELQKNEMTYQVLKLLQFMTKNGFYDDQADINNVALPLISLLNGANDSYSDHNNNRNLSMTGVSSAASMGQQRYFPNLENDIMVRCKSLACDILHTFSNLETDAKCVTFISKLKMDILAEEAPLHLMQSKLGSRSKETETYSLNKIVPAGVSSENQEANSFFENVEIFELIAKSKGFEFMNENVYICVLFDLLLYRYPDLAQRVFSLLVHFFTRRRTIDEVLSMTQLLESDKSIQSLNKIKSYNKELKTLQAESQYWLQKNIAVGIETKRTVQKYFKILTDFCVDGKVDATGEVQQNPSGLKDIQAVQMDWIKQQAFLGGSVVISGPSEEYILFQNENLITNSENQRLCKNFGLADIALFFIKQRVDRVTNYNENYINMIKQCYRFMVVYVKNNFENQLKVYDDLDFFMRDIDKYQVASLLIYEIFKNNKKFLTLNVSKYLRQIVNSAEETALISAKKSMYLKLLEVFCRYEDKLVRQNQSEIITLLTSDTGRSNVLYLFSAEGIKELKQHIKVCQNVLYNDPKSVEIARALTKIKDDFEDPDSVKEAPLYRRESITRMNNELKDSQGVMKMSVPIFNIIQLLKLVSLCCQGKSDSAEAKCKEFVLDFKVGSHVVQICEKFWPLKQAVINYISHTYLDSGDQTFLSNPVLNMVEDDEEGIGKDNDSDIGCLLKIIDEINRDIDDFLEDRVVHHKLKMPNGQVLDMKQCYEQYIFLSCLPFLKNAFKRKTYDVGSTELKFYVIAKNIAQLFYATSKNLYKSNTFELLKYIHMSERHSKYLDNVKHPAKKMRTTDEVNELFIFENEDAAVEQTNFQKEDTKSMRVQAKLMHLSLSKDNYQKREREFEDLVLWVTNIDQKIHTIMQKSSFTKTGEQMSPFDNVSYNSVVAAILRLLDARCLEKDMQIAGIKMLRKIVEVENKDLVTPAADWDSEDWVHCKRIIKMKQDSLVERGTVQFLCKHISETDDEDMQEEILLTCITLLLGGNKTSQDMFYEYMTTDRENKVLIQIKQMLQRYFELSKKYLTEKNAKLQMLAKIQKRANQREKNLERQRMQKKEMFQDEHHEWSGEDSDDKLLSIQGSDEEDLVTGETRFQQNEKDNQENQKRKVVLMCIRILRFLQLLCEGHHNELQNHLREQKNEIKVRLARSFDFVAFASYMLSIYVKSYVNCYSTVLGNQIIESLVEFIQGPCRENQKTLVDTKAIDCCRDMLQQGTQTEDDLSARGFLGSRKDLLDEIKMNSVRLLLSIIEGPVEEEIYKKVSSSLGDFEIMLKRLDHVYESFLVDELGLAKDAPPNQVSRAMKKDSFQGSILEGFDIYSLLNQLAEVIPKNRETLTWIQNKPSYKFFSQNTGNIEVTIDNEVQRIYFQIQPVCCHLTEQTKNKFLRDVDRETAQHKILGLLESIPNFLEEMEHIEQMSHQKIQITPHRLTILRDLSTILAFIIGAFILTSFSYEYVPRSDGSQDYIATIPDMPNKVVFGLGVCQAFTAFILLVGFCINKINLIVKAGWRLRIQHNQLTMLNEIKILQQMRLGRFEVLRCSELDIQTARMVLQVEGPNSPIFFDVASNKHDFAFKALSFEYYWISLSFLISSGEFLFCLIYWVVSIQGLIQSPVFYSLHLLDIVNRFSALNNVIKSVTMNLNQLLMTAMLGLIIIYIYAAFAFLFISDNYFDANINKGLLSKAGDSVCMSLMHCFLSTINYGLRQGGGIGEFLPDQTAQDYNIQAYYIRFVFDVSFYLIVITILLNLIFGIIIDTFAQLREKSQQTSEDIKNICFICGLDRYTLDRDTEEGFDYHKDTDHVIWNYTYFIIHLMMKDKTDFNGTESSIYIKLEKEDISWFPMHKSLRLTKEQRRRQLDQVESNHFNELEKHIHSQITSVEEQINSIEQLVS